MNDDAELLRRYVADHSQPAFAELVERHLALVYHTALRCCGGDTHRAQDVAQAVFTDLARKAATLAQHTSLAGWLYTSARFAAAQAVRTEVRRQAREQEAHAMSEVDAGEPAADWERLRPVIDDALESLAAQDRDAVLLRFFEGQPFAEIGARLALTEDTARRRVDRALDKMRAALARHGLTSTAAALSAALATQAGAAVPTGLAAQLSATALAGSAVAAATASTAATAAFTLTMTKLQLIAAFAVLAVGTTTLVWQHQTNTHLEDEIARLRTENVRLSASAAQAADAREQGAAATSPRALAAGSGTSSSGTRTSSSASSAPAATKLRGEQTVPLAAGLTPIESLPHADRASARDAFETQLWAARAGELDLEAASIELTPDSQKKLADAITHLPDDLRARCGTPERLMAFVLAGSPHPVGGMRVLGETQEDADNVVLDTQWQHIDDAIVHHNDAHFHRTDDGWKFVVPDILVDRALAYLMRQ